MRWTPESLAAAAGGRLLRTGTRPIAGAFIDSRTPRPDGLFVPIEAARDGHDFIEAAVLAGASATLTAPGRALPAGDVTVVEVPDTLVALGALARDARARIDGPVVAITGSNGKTTTRAMIGAVLASAYPKVLCTKGNFNNHLGLPLTLLDAPHEPDAAVLELGMSAPGENAALSAIAGPTVGVVTSVAIEHLEFMGTLDAIADAEAEIMPFVRPGGALVLPAEEPMLLSRVPADYGPTVLTAGIGDGADVRITDVRVGPPTSGRISIGGAEAHSVTLQTFGAHNLLNAASALAVAHHLGLPLGPAVAALEAVAPVGDRGRVHAWREHVLIADCYNANPGSLEVALASLAAMRKDRSGPLCVVLGDMLELGPTAEELHAQVGQRAAELGVDAFLGFGPLSEAAVTAASAAGVESVHVADDIDAVTAWVHARLDGAEPGAVLFKGSRGMRLERSVRQLVGAGD